MFFFITSGPDLEKIMKNYNYQLIMFICCLQNGLSNYLYIKTACFRHLQNVSMKHSPLERFRVIATEGNY